MQNGLRRIIEKGETLVAKPNRVLDKTVQTWNEATDSEAGRGLNEQQMETKLDLQQTKRLQIIDTSITLFSKFGYDAVKVSDITGALQMGKGTFYLYFKNKRELLLACFDRLYSLLVPLEMWDVIRNEKDIFAKLRHRWTGGNERYSAFSGVLSLIRTSCFWDEEEVKEKARRAYDVIIAPIRKDVEEAIAKGIIKRMDADLASYAIIGVMEGLSFRLTLDSHFSNEEGADFVFSFLRSGLADNKTAEEAEKSAQGLCATVTDMNGVAIDLADVCFAGLPYLVGKFSDAEIRVDVSRLSIIKMRSVDSTRIAQLTAKNGQEMTLEIDDNILITGDTPFGGLQIPLDRVSQICFRVQES